MKKTVLNGTPEEVIEQAAEWRDHGLRYLVAANVSVLQPSLRKSLASGAPFFKILRGLKKLGN
jgi:phthiodiolone/phenolphthiodiolone dimycocerosates ketoreductase